MSLVYKNITGNTATALNDGFTWSQESFTEMSLCNAHASDAVNVDLYITKTYNSSSRKRVGDDGNWDALETTTETYYILNNTTIPNGATLVLPKERFEWSPREYKLYIQLNASDSAVDVIINGEKLKVATSQTGKIVNDQVQY